MTFNCDLCYELRQMKEHDASEIGKWQYEPPYGLYNMGDDPGDLQELLDGSYYAVTAPGNVLTGFKKTTGPGAKLEYWGQCLIE